MRQVSEIEIKNRISLENPWWQVGEGVGALYENMPRRAYLNPLHKLATSPSNRALVLMGQRRIGKTVLLHHLISRLISDGTPPDHIAFLSIDSPVYSGLSLERLTALFLEQFQHTSDSRLYIFFDEIQYLKNWEVHLKSLVDTYPHFRFIASGSAAAALRLKSQESGAGRFTDFTLPPPTFSEFLSFIGREAELIREIAADTNNERRHFEAIHIAQLNDEFVRYLNFGGYPEAVFSEHIRSNSDRYIKSDIIDKVLLRDLPGLYGIHDVQELNQLFSIVAYNSGDVVSLAALARSSGIAKNTIGKYLDYLEAAFLIKRLYRIDQSAKRLLRERSYKVYLTNPSIRSALFGNLTSQSAEIGHLAETAILSQYLHTQALPNTFYANWKQGEIDFVAMNRQLSDILWLVEVKWSDRAFQHRDELDSIATFVHQNTTPAKLAPFALRVTSLTKQERIQYRDLTFDFIPTSLYAYSVGVNSIS